MKKNISLAVAIFSLAVSIINLFWGNNLFERIGRIENQSNKTQKTVEQLLSKQRNTDGQNPPSSDNVKEIMHFTVPNSFRCGADLKWKDLQSWENVADKQICSDGDAYRVEGTIDEYIKGILLTAEIYVPETNQWYPSSGGGITFMDYGGPVGQAHFSADFCLRKKGPERTFRFKLAQNDNVIAECRIHISGI